MSTVVDVNQQFELIRLMLEDDSGRVAKASLKEMDKAADDIVFHAQVNAPVDKYNLEKAIYRDNKSSDGRTRQTRDPVTGRFVSAKITVGIKDIVMDQETGEMVNVGQYWLIMEESDRANLNLPGNRAKLAAGGKPGRKYMERAYQEVEPHIISKMTRAARAAI